MGTTSDPKDPRLGRGADEEPKQMNEVYLVLSDEERAKGFVRPVRDTYMHTGRKVCGRFHALESPLAVGQVAKVCSMQPDHEGECTIFIAVTRSELDRLQRTGFLKGCDTTTTMTRAIAETYARDPHFYGSTYCVHCQMHRPVGPWGEFAWLDGSKVGT